MDRIEQKRHKISRNALQSPSVPVSNDDIVKASIKRTNANKS